jgi:hypothetical protein
MHLRPRLNSLEKNFFHDLSGVPNTGSSGKFMQHSNFTENINFDIKLMKVERQKSANENLT